MSVAVQPYYLLITIESDDCTYPRIQKFFLFLLIFAHKFADFICAIGIDISKGISSHILGDNVIASAEVYLCLRPLIFPNHRANCTTAQKRSAPGTQQRLT